MTGIRCAALVATLTLAMVFASDRPAKSQSVEQFYTGNTVTVLLGQPPGGSYDLYGRLAVDYLKKFIPGNPNVTIQYKPGGGGAVAVAFFYDQAPRDGSMIGLFAETLGHIQLIDPQIGKWKMEEMTYIGSFAGVNAAFVRRKESPAKTIDEMKKVQMNMGCSGKTSQSYQSPAMLKNLADFKFNLICGYPGSAEYILALEKGEVDMVSSAWNSWASVHAQKLASGDFVPMIQSGLKRHKDLPNIPLMQDLVSDPKLKKALEFASAGAAIGRALIAPPKIPQDRLDALRAAFDKMVKDPEFIAEAKKRGAELDPSPGAEVQKASLAIVGAEKDVVELAKKGMQ
jgi:tripartite-type tricarboxylate transporter receptor subunit TctC